MSRRRLPLTEDEIASVFRNEFYTIDNPNYFRHKCTGYRRYTVTSNGLLVKRVNTRGRKVSLQDELQTTDED